MRPQTFTDVPSTRKPSSLRLQLQAGADEPRPNVCEIQKNHPNPAQPCANSSKRCIKRARTEELIEALEEASDVGYLDNWDRASWDVPSIADHPQNAHRTGFFPIVRTIADLWNRIGLKDPNKGE